MLAARLMTGGSDRKAIDNSTLAFVGPEASDGLDFSVRGSAFRISPTAAGDADGAGLQTAVLTGVQPAMSSTLSSGAGGNSFNGEAFSDGQPELDAISSKPATQTDKSESAGFSALVHSQGSIHASSDKPSEVISSRVVDTAKVINQVVRDVKLHMQNDTSQLTIRLDPPHLGALRVEIVSNAGTITANLQSSNETVRSLLETNLPMLKDSLSQAGIRVDSFNVSSGTDFSSQFNQHRGSNWQQSGRHYGTQSSDSDMGTAAAFTSRQLTEATVSYNWLA
jgi:flagellar hook-length control protein FliK